MVDIIFAISEVIFVVSYLCRSMLLLRLITMLGSTGYITGSILAGYDAPGMGVLIVFNIVIILVNLVQAYFIIIERLPGMVPENLKEIYKKCFQSLTVNEFLKLMKLSKIIKSKAGRFLTTAGQPVPEIILIKTGSVKIFKNNICVTELPEGFFIGEMSFLTGEPANATVEVAIDNTESVHWYKEKLKKLADKEPVLYAKFKDVLAINLIRKIDKKVQSESVP